MGPARAVGLRSRFLGQAGELRFHAGFDPPREGKMTGYCTECGQPILGSGLCRAGHTPTASTVAVAGGDAMAATANSRLPVGASTQALSLPKAKAVPRLAAAGIEYLLYLVGIWLVITFSLATGLVAGLIGPLPLSVLVALRDFRGGALSISKRVAGLRVVDRKSGLVASNFQALIRNSYYVLLLLLMALPGGEFVAVWPFKMMVVTDGLLILVNPRGRRLGDFLAGTQVVAERQ